MSLLKLPTELLQMVIADCRPDGVEALVQTCREIYEAADRSILHEHRFYKREYTNLLEIISFYMRAKPGEKGYLGPNVKLYEPGEVTLALLDEPLAGQYIKLLELASSSEDTFDMVEAETGGFEDIPGRERLLPLIESSNYIKAAEQYSLSYQLPTFLGENRDMPDFGTSYSKKHAWIWRTGIMKGNRDAAAGLLLALAPNLRHLRYSFPNPKQSWYIGPVLQAAAAERNKSGILSKLETVKIGNLSPFQIQELCPFLALPSIKNLEVMGVTGWADIDDEQYVWKYGNRTSSVEKVDVYDGDADFYTIGRFLQPLRKLRVFHWSHGCVCPNGCADWDGNAFVQAIAMTVGWHLQELGLTFTHATQCVSTTGIDHFLSFQTLKYLELDLQLLLGKLNLKRNEDTTSEERWTLRRPRPQQSSHLHHMPRLADVLPPSIERLRLWVSKHVLKPERMLQHITQLCNLKHITIVYYIPEEHYTRDGPPEPFPPLPAHQFHSIAKDLEPFGVNLDVAGSRGPPGLWRRNCSPDSDHLYTPAEMLPPGMEYLDVDVNVGPV